MSSKGGPARAFCSRRWVYDLAPPVFYADMVSILPPQIEVGADAEGRVRRNHRHHACALIDVVVGAIAGAIRVSPPKMRTEMP